MKMLHSKTPKQDKLYHHMRESNSQIWVLCWYAVVAQDVNSPAIRLQPQSPCVLWHLWIEYVEDIDTVDPSFKATLVKGHPYYQAIFQMNCDSETLVNGLPQESLPSYKAPFINCRRGEPRWKYKRETTVQHYTIIIIIK